MKKFKKVKNVKNENGKIKQNYKKHKIEKSLFQLFKNEKLGPKKNKMKL